MVNKPAHVYFDSTSVNHHSIDHMSLTSTELNYLVWRYLQESGFDLAAYALEKHAQCSSYEHNKNLPIISRIEPGCLVNLVQKGILFSVAEEEAGICQPDASKFSLLGALVKEELEKQKQEDEQQKEESRTEPKNNNRFALKSEAKDLASEDVEMKDDEDKITETEQETEEEELNIQFATKVFMPDITYPECLTSDWHPSTDVFAYGKDNSTAVINAIKDNIIAESVTLNHPNILQGSSSVAVNNEITTVTWAPQGTMIVTAGINGELRAWSPDGKLKNIANTAASFGTGAEASAAHKPESSDVEQIPSLISSLIWSESGQFLLSIDVNNQVCLWDGNNLNLIQQIKSPTQNSVTSLTIDACWLDDSKFAISTLKNSIKIYTISIPQVNGNQFNLLSTSNTELSVVKPIGFLSGHINNISILKFNSNSKLLASCSDFDYIIKIWQSSSTQESLELNVPSDERNIGIKYHSSPIIGLFWLTKSESSSALLSVSMEGIVNIWNALSGDVIISTNLFKNEENFNFSGDEIAESFINKKDSLVFIASVSPDCKWLAIGDDSGRISVWDVSPSRYSKKRKDVLRCMGCHEFNVVNEHKSDIGICDLVWDNKSSKLSVSYKGAESAIFNWQ